MTMLTQSPAAAVAAALGGASAALSVAVGGGGGAAPLHAAHACAARTARPVGAWRRDRIERGSMEFSWQRGMSAAIETRGNEG